MQLSRRTIAPLTDVITHFKKPRNPHKKLRAKSASRRPGMDPNHVKMVATLPSCISGKYPCDAHHLRVRAERGTSLRATDRWCVPLTREEHNECHKLGSKREEAWFLKQKIACYELANALWGARGFRDVMLRIIEAHETHRPKDR